MREEQNNFATFGWKDEACSTFWSDFSTWIYALCLAIIIQIAGVALGKSVKLFWLVLCVCEGTLKKTQQTTMHYNKSAQEPCSVVPC